MNNDPPVAPEAFEAELRDVGRERYHNLHPFHKLLHGGKLTLGQVQAWALNRYYYQSRIPIKDGIVISRLDDPDLRRAWRSRLIDHDGEVPGEGGVARWLHLCEGLGLDCNLVRSTRGILPITRFAVDAYVDFVRQRGPLEAVASSLTEMFSPAIIGERVSGMLANYTFVDMDKLAYFKARLDQAPRDAEFALDFVKRQATTRSLQRAAVAALTFKCDLLWAQLDGLYYSYVSPGFVPPGAFVPAAQP